MRVCVDPEACIGCGLCADTAPEAFRLDDEGKAHAIAENVGENQDAVLEAIENCPVGAIHEG